MNGTDGDHDVIVELFTSGSAEFGRAVEGLSAGRLDSLIEGLREKAGAGDPDAVLNYARMLFSHERTRDMGLLLGVRLMQGGLLADRAAMLCLPEMRAAVVSGAKVAVRDGEEDEAGLVFLMRLCKALVGFLDEEGAVGRFEGLSARVQAGHALALELFPSAIQCLDSLSGPAAALSSKEPAVAPVSRTGFGDGGGQEVGSAAQSRSEVVSALLHAKWPRGLLLPLQAALADLTLTAAEEELACKHVTDPQLDLAEEHFIGLIQVLLSVAERCGGMQWLDGARAVLERTPEHLLGDAYCVVEMSLQNGSRLMGLLLRSFAAFCTDDQATKGRGRSGKRGRPAPAPEGAPPPLMVSDLNLMLVVAQNDLFRDIVMDSMISALGTPPPPPPRLERPSQPPPLIGVL